ncbi:MAG: AAA family ATPase [Deltaproteobacteria bacterium]|nr:MAG: AAA family ATPase [Deltaproteobacteria bacterium]
MFQFIGREEELKGLRTLLNKKSASLVVIKGRRRIGKSRLAEEFGKNFDHTYSFAGLAPTVETTNEHQKKEFLRQMHLQKISTPIKEDGDWGDIFTDLARKCYRGRVLIIIDEISWIGAYDPTFLGKLKTTWDQYFKKNSKLVLILSGSQSTWIEQNIINNTGFLGRISYQLTLQELALSECNQFWKHQKLISPYEKFKLLSVTGGIPRYLEEIQPQLSAEENVRRLCFKPEGLLFNEFEQIFSDLFSKRSNKYKLITQHLVEGPSTADNIASMLERSKGGDLSLYLEDLCTTGFVTRDYTWDIKAGRPSKLSQYRLSDNYVRFYLKWVEPNRNKILSGVSGYLSPAWLTSLGFQFENLVMSKKNRPRLYEKLGIPPGEIVWANPFFQTKTQNRQGCQIDFMILTKFNILYLCEIKFRAKEIDKDIIQEIQQKIDRLSLPRNFSIRPILIHVNGFHESLIESEFFSHIIDFADFLEE